MVVEAKKSRIEVLTVSSLPENCEKHLLRHLVVSWHSLVFLSISNFCPDCCLHLHMVYVCLQTSPFYLFIFLKILLFICLILAVPCNLRALIPNQRLNSDPGQSKCRVLTTRPPRNPQISPFYYNTSHLALGAHPTLVQTNHN